MAVELRSGSYGQYYGSTWGSSSTLTTAQGDVNARYIYSYLTDFGWSLNAIAGLLGNVRHESALNPGRWQGDNVGVGPAYGLVQWDPYSKYTDWCSSNGLSDPSTMDANLDRIIWELENGAQFYETNDYPLTFREFTQSTESPYYLACAFAWNYERSAVVLWGTEEQKEALRQQRGGSANYFYDLLSGSTPDPGPTPTPTKKKGLSLLMMALATQKRG